MGETEMALLRDVYSHWERGDFRSTHFIQPDFELVFAEDFPESGTYRGREEVSSGWRIWLAGWETWAASAADYIAVGDRILVLIDVRGISKSTALAMDSLSANLWEFRDGLASRLTLFRTRELAFREAGLESP